MAYCVHHVPGRVRFKVPQLQRDPASAGDIEKKVLALDGVIHVEVNERAWSMVVHYDTGANPLDDIIEQIEASGPVNGARDHGVASPSIIPPRAGHANGQYGNGTPEMSRFVGQAIGQAIFATLVQRTLDRSLLSLLTGLR